MYVVASCCCVQGLEDRVTRNRSGGWEGGMKKTYCAWTMHIYAYFTLFSLLGRVKRWPFWSCLFGWKKFANFSFFLFFFFALTCSVNRQNTYKSGYNKKKKKKTGGKKLWFITENYRTKTLEAGHRRHWKTVECGNVSALCHSKLLLCSEKYTCARVSDDELKSSVRQSEGKCNLKT